MYHAYQRCLVGAFLAITAWPAIGQSLFELPLNADNCAIHRALSPETSGSCGGNGPSRGIVLRIDDALQAERPALAANSVASILQRPIAPTIRVAAAPAGAQTRTDASAIPISHAAAPSKDGYFVQFAFDSAILEPQFQEHLNRLSQVLRVKAMASTCLKIIGHTDTVGAAGYNLKLSKTRAVTVANYLRTKRDIPTSRISTEAAGETRPLPDLKGADALNRRVEFATKESVSGC